MALMDSVQATPVGKAFEYDWRVENWMTVKESKKSIQQQKLFIHTTDRVTWEIGLMTNPTNCCSYLKLLKNGAENYVQHSVHFWHQERNGTWHRYFTSDGDIKVHELRSSEDVNPWKYTQNNWYKWTDANGALCLRITFTVVLPDTPDSRCLLRLAEKAKSNFEAALNDSSSSDLTIITSDKRKHRAHKLILKIQCPVFAAMLSSQFAENTTGIVNVKDISGKTMGILLHLFYTGQLLDSWSDADTLLEFTYAAGKYQMDQVLEMLDQVLGGTAKVETGELCVQLIGMANKLSLKNAEARLLKRVHEITAKFVSLEQYTKLFAVKETDSQYMGINEMRVNGGTTNDN